LTRAATGSPRPCVGDRARRTLLEKLSNPIHGTIG